jgi:hypothetical protein
MCVIQKDVTVLNTNPYLSLSVCRNAWSHDSFSEIFWLIAEISASLFIKHLIYGLMAYGPLIAHNSLPTFVLISRICLRPARVR